MKIRPPLFVVLALTSLILPLAGCDDPQASPTAAQTGVPPEVAVVTLQPKPRAYIRELPGRIAPTRIAEVRARIPGIVLERAFNQGIDVEAGSTLYRLDPTPFQVEVDAATAALDKAEAALALAQQQASRAEHLVKERAMAVAQYEMAVASRKQAEAEVAARKADLARAKLNLDYTVVRAPIKGRVGRALVTEGALVGQGEATHLATVQQLDPIYADFTQSVTELNRLRRDIASGALEQIEPHAVKVKLVLDDETVYPLAGKLLFSEATVDQTTGQVTLRGEFPNPNRDLLPGMYVRVQIEEGVDSDALAVPQQAVRRNDSGGSFVYLLKPENRAAVQPVRTGPVVDGHFILQDGVQPGDRVVVDGFQKFVAGDVVAPVTWRDRTTTAEAEPTDGDSGLTASR
jgi:membrane fusion protein (multidrug efflux system)